MLPNNISLEEMMSSQAKQLEWLKFLTENGGALMGQKYVKKNKLTKNLELFFNLYILGLLNY